MDNLSLTNIIEQLPGYIGWKDSNFSFLGCNINKARKLKLKNTKDIIGLCDADLSDQTNESASFHQKHDKIALSGKMIKTINRSALKEDKKTYFQIKKPLINNDEIIGVIYHCIEFIYPQLYSNIQELDKRYSPQSCLPLFYELEFNDTNNPCQLSSRELECLFCLLRGMTAKKTGEYLDLSKRTIEFYIENIKNKMGCHSKSELIDCALIKGYMSLLPPQFLERNLECIATSI